MRRLGVINSDSPPLLLWTDYSNIISWVCAAESSLLCWIFIQIRWVVSFLLSNRYKRHLWSSKCNFGSPLKRVNEVVKHLKGKLKPGINPIIKMGTWCINFKKLMTYNLFEFYHTEWTIVEISVNSWLPSGLIFKRICGLLVLPSIPRT